MKFIKVNKILSTERSSVNQIFENRGKIYTYLNPVSYLTALDNKELFRRLDGLFAMAVFVVLYNMLAIRSMNTCDFSESID